MSYFIIGDVHGCYYTLKKLLKHWDRTQQLIFVGDYINKGKHSDKVIKLVRQLQQDYPDTICIKGNHEYQMSEYIIKQTPMHEMKENYRNTLQHYDLRDKHHDDLQWMRQLPLYYETDVIYVSHAGVNWLGFRKFQQQSRWSVLTFRGKLKKMKKLQVIGHTPTLSRQPEYTAKYNSLNIDSGAGNFECMSAVVIDQAGTRTAVYIEDIDKDDRP